MNWLNYHHLLYFWTVAREGGLAPAGKVLHLSNATLSAQIRTLEQSLGEKLFVKQGRRLVLTELGRVAYRYAEEIFGLGRELVETLQGHGATARAPRLKVGILDVMPKLVVRRLLQPALELDPPAHLVCFEESWERLLGGLALHEYDLLITDAPVPPGSQVRAYNHALGDTGVSFFAAPKLARALEGRFPKCLHEQPVLMPLESNLVRRDLNLWFSRHGVTPRVVAEFEDSALLKVFGSDGVGVFPAATLIEEETCAQYGVKVVGRIPEVRERFFVISAERRLQNPAVQAICTAARADLQHTS
ncbi:MAG: transcriptional activator NhaR [Myxococcaceae bacterium]